MKRGNFAEQFAQFEINGERRDDRRGDQCRKTRAEFIQCAQPHELFELHTAHRVHAETAARDLHDQFLAAGFDLADEIADHFAQHRRTVQQHARRHVFRIFLRRADVFTDRPHDAQ